MKRKKPTLTEKCASALLQLRDEQGELLIPWDHARLMSSEQVLSLFQFDHYPIRVEAGGTNHPSNLVPMLIAAHRKKTRLMDLPELGKIRRITQEQENFRSRLLAKQRGDPKPKSRWPKRPMRKK